MRTPLFLIAFLVLAVTQGNAQAPDFVFQIAPSGNLPPSISLSMNSWSGGGTITSSGTYNSAVTYSGTRSNASVSMYSKAEQHGNSCCGGVTPGARAQYTLSVFAKNGGSVTLAKSISASVSNVAYYTPGDPSSATYGPLPSGGSLDAIGSGGNVNVTGSSSDSATQLFNVACGTAITTFSEYPGAQYKIVTTYGTNVGSHTSGSIQPGDLVSEGTYTISATRGTDAPTTIIQGPLVGGVPTSNPAIGSSLSFNNLSYDIDNSAGTAALNGICSAAWVLTDPDGTQTNYTNLSGIAFTATKQGWYSVKLTATDNEGDSAVAETGFLVGTARTHDPDEIASCHGNCGIDPSSGAGYCVVHDPAVTRGYPLANSLSISTQGNFRTRVRPAGNFHFTYGMFVDETTRTDGVDTSYSHLFLVDGDGKEIDLGRASAGISQPAYMFSDISATTSGFTVENAGAPGQIESRGNFTYHFDLDGKLLDITDPQGNQQTVSYNTDGTPSVVTDVSTGKTLEFEYDTPGLVARFVENGGAAVTHLSYDTSNRVTDIAVKDSLGTTVRSYTFSYDSAGRLYQTTRDGISSTTATFTYRKWNDDVYTANLSWSGGGTSYIYSAAPPSGATFKTTRVNSKGATTTYEFDARYNLTKVTRPIFNNASAAPVTTMTYNANDTLATSSDGAVTYTYTTNSDGLVTRIDDSGGKYVQYTYSGADLTKVEDNIGTRVEYQYGNTSQPHVPTAVLDGLGRTWSYTLNAHGQVTQVTPPTGSPEGATVYSYDETASSPTLGMLMSMTNGNNESTGINSQTSLGDPTSVSTFPSTSVTNTTDYEYDSTQRMTKVSYSDGKEIDYTHNGRDLASVTDEAGSSTSYSYCPMCSALTGQSEPLSRNLSWSLDADFDMTSFTDPRSYVTTYVLGNAKEVKQIQYPDSITHTLKYDNYARLKSITNQRGNVGTLTYDSSGQVSSLSYGAGHNDNVSYTYFTDGSINTITSRASVITYTYTAARQVASVTFDYTARGLTPLQKVEYTYYADGKINTIVWKNGTSTVGTWTYNYDAAGRISSVSNSFGESASYTYDGEGKILTQTNGNGTSTDYTYYEPRGWVTSIAHKLGSTSFQSYAMEFDSTLNTVGNITKITELSGDYTTYTYDALYRLTGETRTGANSYAKTYGYDVSGNLTMLNGSTFATYDSGNKLATLSGGSVTYDTDGNMTGITGGTSGVPSGNFGWNAFDRITQQKTSSITVNYVPDGLGRRGYYSNTTSGDKRYFVFHGDLLLGEVTNSAANRVAYTWGPDGLVSERLLQSNSSRYYHFGPQGETRALTNGSGTVTDTNLFSAYGVSITSSGSSINHHQYGGKYGYYSDAVTGALLATHRWYHPYLARWLTRDPIGYSGGANLYEYVRGRPSRFQDRLGLNPAIDIATKILGPALSVVEGGGGTAATVASGGEASASFGPVGIVAGVVVGGVVLWCEELDPKSCIHWGAAAHQVTVVDPINFWCGSTKNDDPATFVPLRRLKTEDECKDEHLDRIFSQCKKYDRSTKAYRKCFKESQSALDDCIKYETSYMSDK